jgi:16S rRNA processing protein RimM
VLAPFGLKGELKVQALTDNARRFAPKSRLWAGQQPVTVISSREAQGYVYVTLKGFKDRSSVERFRHAMLQVPEDSLPPLDDGAYYRFQLIGLRVVDREGIALGTLEEIIVTGANDVYRVRTSEGTDVLLPAREDVILGIDLETATMTVDPPEWR